MRDPDRIPLVLAAVERAWVRNPDARLGQVLVGLLRKDYPDLSSEDQGKRLFALEDGELLKLIGPENAAELDYIAREPEEARQGWKESMAMERKNRPPDRDERSP